MNISRGIQTIVGIGLVAYVHRAVGRAGDDRNVRTLARHVGCSIDDARRLYVLARQDGYGSAYRQVFPSRQVPQRDPSAPDMSVDVRAREPRQDQPIHH